MLPACFERQHVATRLIQTREQQAGEPGALVGIGEIRLERIGVDRQRSFFLEQRRHVLVCGDDRLLGQTEPLRQLRHQRACRFELGIAARLRIGEERLVLPQRLAVATPMNANCPPRQRLARIPLSLPVMQQRSGREVRLEPLEEPLGQHELGGPEGRDVPFGAFHVVDRHEGGLAALRQTHVVRDEIAIDALAQRIDGCPLRFAVRSGDSRILVHAREVHRDPEIHLAHVGQADHRCGVAGISGTRERQVALAGKESRGWIEPDPACARQVRLGPGVEIGEIVLRAGRPFDGLLIRGELDQIARREARGNAQMTQYLYQQPAGIAA